MFGVAREFQAPLGVTHAVCGYFGPSTTLSTVFARKTSIDVYVVRANDQVARLELVQSTALGVNIVSMCVLSRGSAHDLLVLGFDRMRVAVLAWHHDTRSWITAQLIDHAALLGSPLCSPSSIMSSQDPRDQGRPILRGMVGTDSQPLIKADPSGRCLGVLARSQNVLYIVPISVEEDAYSLPTRVFNPADVFLVDLSADYEATNAKDFVFLHGSFEPNVVVLYEPNRTWAGRAAIQRNTSQILNISIDIQSKRTSKTWTVDQLPYDSIRLEPIPESAGGGILLLCTSVIMQLRHGACVAGLSLNCFGDSYATEVKNKFETIKESDTLVECDGAHCRFLDIEETPGDSSHSTQSIALLSLKGGELYFLHIAVASRNAIVMKRAGSTVIASEIVPINHRFFILASRLSDSLLVEYQTTAQDTEVAAEMANGDGLLKSEIPVENKSDSKKRKKRKRSAQDDAEYEMIFGVKPPQDSTDDESEEGGENDEHTLNLDQKDEGTRGVYDDEDELGWVFNSGTDETTSKGSSSSGKWALKVKDTLPCFGPGSDLAIGTSPDDDSGSKLDMVVAGGYAKNGCLAVVHQSVRPTFSANFEVPGCNGVWALRDPPAVNREREALRLRNELRNKKNMERRLNNAKKIADRTRYVEEAVNALKRKCQSRQESQVVDEANADEIFRTGNADESSDSKPGSEAAVEKVPENIPGNVTDVEDGLNDASFGAQQSKDVENHAGVLVSFTEAENTTGTKDIDVTSDLHPKGIEHGSLNHTKEETEELQETEQNLKTQEHERTGKGDAQESAPKRRKTEITGPPEAAETQEEVIASEDIQRIEDEADAKFPLEEEIDLEEGIPNDPALHSIILMTTDSNTMVLRSGAELEEVNPDSVGLIGSEQTVAAGNIFGSYAIVQVSLTKVRVLRDGSVLCEFDMSSVNQKIKRAQICDPMVLVECTSDHIYVLSISAQECGSENEDFANGSKEENGDEYDEYGIGRPAKTDEDRNRLHRAKAIKGESPSSKSYRNFSISIDFSSNNLQTSRGSVLAACLYSGSVASEVRQDGVLEQIHKPETNPENSYAEEKELDTLKADRDQETSGADFPGRNEADLEIDDEDLMLYGGNEDEEDKLLYGTGEEDKGVLLDRDVKPIRGGTEADNNIPSLGVEKSINEGEIIRGVEKGTVPMLDEAMQDSSQDFLLLMVRNDGSLEILARELQYSTVLECPFFFAAPHFVSDIGVIPESEGNQTCPVPSEELIIDGCTMTDLPSSALHRSLSIPVLIATSRNGMPLLYRVFTASRSNVQPSSRSRLVMERIVHRDRTTYLLSRSLKHAKRKGFSDGSFSTTPPPISSFQNIAGRAGLFVGGNVPFFVFAERGYPRVHPLTQTPRKDGSICRDDLELGQSVTAFTEFHNVMCPRGFLCTYNDGETRIGELPPLSLMNYDAPTPMRKIALRCTPHKVSYHSGSATYGILASMPTLTTREERLARILQSLEKHDKRHYSYIAAQAEAETGNEQANRVPPLFEELHELRVYRPDTWDLIKSHKLAKGEVGLAISNMTVDVYKQRLAKDGEIHSSKKDDDGNESPFAASIKMRPKNVLAVGTGNLNGEDAGSRGRLLLFEISRQEGYTETGSFTSFQLQLIAEKDLPAPVTAVAAMEGYVIAGVGPQISVYKLVGDELIHLSFAFGQLYCTSIASLKQYVVAADMCKSVSFMYFRDRNNSVNFLGKDYEHVRSYATEFLIENEHMSIIVSDGSGNFQLMNYVHASNPQSRGGKRLLVNGGINFGSRVNKFVRFRVPDGKQVVENGTSALRAGKHSLLFPTLDGGIGGLISVTEAEFRNLSKVWSYMVNDAGMPRLVGIHPDEQCEFRAERASTVLLDQRLLDGRAVFEIFSMSVTEMRLVTKKVGVKMDTLLETLLEMDSLLSRF